jgi:rubrerythrin
MHDTTRKNLQTAMRGEAYAFAKYQLYAQRARQDGRPDLAELFERTAGQERLEHFAEEASLLGLAGTDEENLRDAIAGEAYEVETMYREFAEQAEAVGDAAAADRFREIREDEAGHRDAFEAALTALGSAAAS